MDFNQYFIGKIIRQTRKFLLSLADYRAINRQTHDFLLSLAGYRDKKCSPHTQSLNYLCRTVARAKEIARKTLYKMLTALFSKGRIGIYARHKKRSKNIKLTLLF